MMGEAVEVFGQERFGGSGSVRVIWGQVGLVGGEVVAAKMGGRSRGRRWLG